MGQGVSSLHETPRLALNANQGSKRKRQDDSTTSSVKQARETHVKLSTDGGMQANSQALFELLLNQETERTPTHYRVICLTGGPCGGKTSCLALAKLFAKQGRKSIVICDRGAMDPSAYMPRKDWLRMLDELHLSEASLRDERYDCVVHLVTAAKHAERYYSLLNNHTRSEGIHLAQELDEKIMNAWNGHASLQVIDNQSVKTFAEKCDRVVQAVLTRLGLVTEENRYGRPVTKHKFVVSNFNWDAPFPVAHRDFDVERMSQEHVIDDVDTYLMNPSSDGMQTRIRRRQEMGQKGVHLNMTIRHPPIHGERIETRRNLLIREYEALTSQRDPSRSTIHKKRRCFLYKDRYYQLDVYQHPHAGLVLLEAYLDHSGSDPIQFHSLLPDWLQVEDVTNDPTYSMYHLALDIP